MAFFTSEQADILERYFRHEPHHQELVNYLSTTLENFLTRELAPKATEHDEKEIFSTDLFRKLGEIGFYSLAYPEDFGGMGVNPTYYIAGLESTSKACAGFTLGVAIHGTMCDGLFRFASDALKKRVLPDLLAGRKIGAFALTEPDSGSDAQAMRTSYKVDEKTGDFILNGTKFWITNAMCADYFFLMARSQKDPKVISSFLVEKPNASTFHVNAIKGKMGVRGSNTAEMVFENHRIPKANLIGEEGSGFKYAMHMLNGGRNTIGAWSTGIAQGALEKFVTYASERKLFGKALKDLDNTGKEVSEMLILIRGAREMTYSAAYEKSIGHKNFPRNAALCKVAGTEAAVHVGERVIELAGGYGYLQETKLERSLRDALLGRIGEGANELLKVVVIPRFFYKEFAENPPLASW